MKKILIFYSRTGGGHFRAAEAIASEFNKSGGFATKIVDGLSVTNSNRKLQPQKVFFHFSTTFASVFNFFYAMTDNPQGTKAARLLIRKIWGKAVVKIIKEFQPDVILSTHPALSPQTIPTIPLPPFITVCTDLGEPHNLWLDSKVTKLFVANEEVSSSFTKTYPNAKNIAVSGYPIDRKYRTATSSSKILHRILILGGGSGTGNIEDQVKILHHHFPSILITVVCGINTALQEKLKKKNYKQVKIYGFVDNLSDLISNSDIVLTKAGPGAIIETASLKKPLIITSWVVAQEKGNISYVKKNNLGLYCPDPTSLPEMVKYVYNNYSDYSRVSNFINDGSKNIVQYVKMLNNF